MPFTNPDFPNQVFNTVEELQEAYKKRDRVEKDLASRGAGVTKVTATIVPVPEGTLERKLAELERQVEEMSQKLEGKRAEYNKDNLPIGMVLQGESKGTHYTLEVLEEGYLCSTGEIAKTLSSAAELVSGNRRSGWAFWKDGNGTPIGEITGRFNKDGAASSPDILEMSQL
ncbi:MAG: DUF2924 domain-containing protein [Candidatus Altiarchaeales archaeon]|nr:DUF2924 domain-containing protein [Candidatus Altiarchaeales archaeon]